MKAETVLRATKTDASLLAERYRCSALDLATEDCSHVRNGRDKMITAIPGLSLHQRTGPTATVRSCLRTRLIVMAQGRKRVELGPKTFIYDESRYLLTSLDLPSRQPGHRGE